MTSGNEINKISLEDLDVEARKITEECIKAITQEALMRSCFRTHQGVVLKPEPLIKPSFDMHRPENMEELTSIIIRDKFGIEAMDRAREYQKSYPDYYDNIPYPRGYRVPEFTNFSGEDSRTTWEYVAELNDGSDCITSESEIVLSPKIESQINHVDVGKGDDNVLRYSSEIESKVAMHTYQRPYPERIDLVPYPQGFEVPNFTKFTGEDARTTMEHICQFIEQSGKTGSNDLLKLKLFSLSLSNFASIWYSLLAPNSISTWSQMEHEFHDYFKDASLMEQNPIDNSSVTCDTISVIPFAKTRIVSNPLPISPIDLDNEKVVIRPSQAESTKGKCVIIGDLRPKTRINNTKADDHKVVKDESSSFQKTKKLNLTFEMLMAKYKKGLAGQQFDNQTSDLKRPRSYRRKRFGQTPKQSEPSTIPTPYKPPIVMPWYPYPMSLYGYPFMYYMPWMPQPYMPFHQEWKQSSRSVPSHSFNSSQDRFPQKSRSGGSKVKQVKKVWVRKEAKAPEVVTIKEESQDVQVPTRDAVKTIQAKKTEADAVTAKSGGLIETAGWSDRRLATGLTGPRGWSDRGALEKSGKCGIHLAFEIVQSRKPILLGGQDINMLMKKSKEMNNDGYNITSLSRRLLDAKTRLLWEKYMKGFVELINWPGQRFVLIATDYFIKWAEAVPLKNITYTEANGQAESSNKTLLKLVEKEIEEHQKKWHEVLSEALWTHRIFKHGVTKVTSFELVCGQEAVLPIEVNLGYLRYFKQDDLSVEDYKILMGGNFEDVIDKRLKTLKEMDALQENNPWEILEEILP
uniref:Retrotransposon protein, putative, Ty3-gypsy sub-class n=1 Tax=Oryza sativa subsp. japonica TaxID=39947 RepID=Q53NJ8_ORYSJ|nr:retrotransposon protein, putative, Ty3-gypsy sub-class [Oryza sativa Japonica Group]